MAKERFSSIATLRNVVAMVQLIERVMTRAPTLPGMACFHGPSGYGKSSAATYAANTFDAYYIQAESTWTKKSLCEAICFELGIEPRGRIDQMVREIYREIAATGRPLLIDEADHVVARGLIELVRDIYEKSEASIILIGEEDLPRKLMRWERVHGRMLAWTGAEPGSMADVNLLMDIYCAGIEIDDALKQRILSDTNNSIRRICVSLEDVHLFARRNGLTTVTAADWGQASFFTGQAPKPRGLK
jgi:DNA transposition AAA+ family ATPase